MISPKVEEKKNIKKSVLELVIDQKKFYQKVEYHAFFVPLQRRDGALCETIIMFNFITMSVC